jgi:hypothetical protein
VQAPIKIIYKAPKAEVVNYAGPAAPLRWPQTAGTAEIYRLGLEQFAAISANSVTIPTLTAAMTAAGAVKAQGTGSYTYTGVAMGDIKGGKVVTTTVDRVTFAFDATDPSGKQETISGQAEKLAAHDFDVAPTIAMFDPSRANDDKYYRAYRQLTAGAVTMSLPKGQSMRLDGMTADDMGLRPSKLQFSKLMEIVDAVPPPGTTPTPAQTREMIEKAATIYDGMYIGGFELRGLAIETPEGPLRLGAIKLGKLENGKFAEIAIEGLDARSPQGPVKIGRFALKSLDVANFMRVAAQLAAAGRNPPPDQLAALLLLLEGTEISNVVAPYKNTGQPVTVDTLNISWGQFVGPIPTRARTTLKMSGPVDLADPDPFKALAAAGMTSATINFDLGAAWTEGAKSFALEPATLEIGSVLTAAARLSLANVPREVFSINPLQAAIMAAQIEAGPIELALRDTGGVDLAVAQYARTQNMSREAARAAIIENIKKNGMTMAAANPDAMAIAGAIARFFELPLGTLSIKLTPRGKVPVMQVIETLKANPMAALARFQVDAGNGR